MEIGNYVPGRVNGEGISCFDENEIISIGIGRRVRMQNLSIRKYRGAMGSSAEKLGGRPTVR
jgi:hypothetical protein